MLFLHSSGPCWHVTDPSALRLALPHTTCKRATRELQPKHAKQLISWHRTAHKHKHTHAHTKVCQKIHINQEHCTSLHEQPNRASPCTAKLAGDRSLMQWKRVKCSRVTPGCSSAAARSRAGATRRRSWPRRARSRGTGSAKCQVPTMPRCTAGREQTQQQPNIRDPVLCWTLLPFASASTVSAPPSACGSVAERFCCGGAQAPQQTGSQLRQGEGKAITALWGVYNHRQTHLTVKLDLNNVSGLAWRGKQEQKQNYATP